MEVSYENFNIIILIGLGTFLLVALFHNFKTKKWASNETKKALEIQTKFNSNLENLLLEQKRTNKLLSIIGDVEIPVFKEETQQKTTTSLYVSNIDYATTENDIERIFSKYGRIAEINLPVNKYTGKGRGFGFVKFVDEKEAENSIKLNGYNLNGRQIQVSFAKQ